ncbi:hypothetical protein C8J56DRAFT_775704, partial [Mycena floridula]
AIGSCDSISITIKDIPGAVPVPPYYMMAFEIGGIPTTTLLGSNVSNLKWTVDHAPGTNIILSMADAKGNSGGIPENSFAVISHSSTSCIKSSTSSSTFLMDVNVTDELSTCQPWGMRVAGGNAPYTVTILSEDSPVLTNVSMDSGQDLYTYINRASPDDRILGPLPVQYLFTILIQRIFSRCL